MPRKRLWGFLIRAIVKWAPKHLDSNGVLVLMEKVLGLGFRDSDSVGALMIRIGFL